MTVKGISLDASGRPTPRHPGRSPTLKGQLMPPTSSKRFRPGPRTEPALAAVVARSLGRVGPEPLVVVNRAEEGGQTSWSGRGAAELPDSRMGAQLALAGREPRGDLGRAVALLADRIEAIA